MIDPTNREDYIKLLSRYKKIRKYYQSLSLYIQERLADIAIRKGIYPIVKGRAKSLESFAEKIQRVNKGIQNPFSDLTDLCGVRVITHTLDEVDQLAEAVGQEFMLDIQESEDKGENLAVDKFGYLSKHLTIQLKEPPLIEGFSQDEQEYMQGIRVELQLRTLAQHIWADIYHELGYKNEFQLPKRWEREFARLAALLENCDKGFQQIKDAIASYESTYATYMTEDEIGRLAAMLENILVVDPGNIKVAHRLIKAYLSLQGSDDKIRDMLRDFSDSRLAAYMPALRDFGVAYCRFYKAGSEEFAHGQRLLSKARETDPGNIDAICSLGGTYRREGNLDEALKCYRQAHRLDPMDSFALGNYIAELLHEKKDATILEYFHSAINGAISRCQKQLMVKVNLPWAFFDLGIFHLYQGDFYKSISYYANGIVYSNHSWMISTTYKVIKQFVKDQIGLNGIEIIDLLLKVGYWTRASDKEREYFHWSPAPGPHTYKDPVIVLSGGCGGMETEYEAQLKILKEGMAGFQGMIVSGGTRSGIASIPGELQEMSRPDTLQTVGYVPAKTRPELEALLDGRYSLKPVHTEGDDFSPLEPLAFWEHFLASGGKPESVKLIGFNGGNVSSAEYRLALALGAQVGIIKESGRAADELLTDPFWKKHGNLYAIECSKEAIEAFLSGRIRKNEKNETVILNKND